jgi:hydroxyacylglutathione hydrolase
MVRCVLGFCKAFSGMILERVFDDLLAQAGYVIGCEDTRMAIVIDPNRDIDRYIEVAEREKLTIAYVTETHIHADFISGARELAQRTGARLVLSGSGGPDWQYAFAHESSARLVRDGDVIDIGSVRVVVRETPGHTPEHICFLVTDRSVSERPIGMATGDFIFVGDVGRPDLLERAANVEGSMDALARLLFRSIEAARDLPDYLQLWPGHGAGSACGKALGSMPFTTLGYERIANWAFHIDDENEFVAEVLAGQPEPPTYFARMKVVNRDGPPAAPMFAELPQLDLDALQRAFAAGAAVIDVRSSADFAAGHIPATLNLPMGTSFARWAGTLLSYDRDIVLLADDIARVDLGRHALALIGLDRVVARGGGELRAAWRRINGPLQTVPRVDILELSSAGDRTIVDVRGSAEWNEGHLPRAEHRYLGNLVDGVRGLDRDTPIVLYCQGGTRASIAASLLQAEGFTDVATAPGGIGTWEAAGLPTESGRAEPRSTMTPTS